MFLNDSLSELKVFIYHLNNSPAVLGMLLASPRYKMLIQGWISPESELDLGGEELSWTSFYLGGCIAVGFRKSDEVPSRIFKARLPLTYSIYFQGLRRIGLLFTGEVHIATLRSVRLCSFKTWPLKAKDLRWLSGYEHQCLPIIARTQWRRSWNSVRWTSSRLQ